MAGSVTNITQKVKLTFNAHTQSQPLVMFFFLLIYFGSLNMM